LVGKMRLDGTSDVIINSIPFTIGTLTADASDITSSVTLKLGNEEYTESVGTSNNATGIVVFNNLDYNLAAGETVTFTVSADINNVTTGTFIANDSTSVSLTVENREAMDVENEEGDLLQSSDSEITGASIGNLQTFALSVANISNYAWTVPSAGTLIDFTFTVEAVDEDFDVLALDVASTTAGTAGVSAGVLTWVSGDAVDTISGGYTVATGDTATFRVRYVVGVDTGDINGDYAEVKITSVAGQTVPTNKQLSPTATLNLQ